jgi:hypothetical protein
MDNQFTVISGWYFLNIKTQLGIPPNMSHKCTPLRQLFLSVPKWRGGVTLKLVQVCTTALATTHLFAVFIIKNAVVLQTFILNITSDCESFYNFSVSKSRPFVHRMSRHNFI